MTKAQQFLWCVQTALLNNQLLIARQIETKQTVEFGSMRHIHSVAERAIWAAAQIPESLSAVDASRQFCEYAFDNLWSEGKERPAWLEGMPF